MSILLADNFSYQGRKPLDGRILFDTILDMATIPESTIYDGALAYNRENDKFYVFKNSNVSDSTFGKWRELELTNSSAIPTDAKVVEYKEDTQYEANVLVFLDEKVCRVDQDYTSSNLGSVSQSFEEDIKQKKLLVINTEQETVIKLYNQGNFYLKDNLVYYKEFIYRVVNNFISDDTAPSIVDSIDLDKTAGNLILLNKESEPGVLPYKQNTLFFKNKLVFADGRVGRVLNDYISDNTGTTLEESINIDIHNGNLREMAENYKFKLYKTTQDMDKTIDAINILPISTIQFENGENIGNMQLNEGVYGPLGTLAIIKKIDKNLQQIEAKTVNSREMEFMPLAPDTYTYTVSLAGTGYNAGEIIPTDMANVLVEIESVGSSGEILNVIPTKETITNGSGTGALISANIKFYVGNGKQWYDLPSYEPAAQVAEYIQGNTYKENTLIYFNDILTRALVDFTANSTLGTTEESFKSDLDNGNIIRMTREDVSVPECLGSAKTDSPSDLPATPIKGNWVLIEDCTNNAPGQAGIGLYNGTTWNISPIPQGTFQFPEPTDDGKLYFRERDAGVTDGQWKVFDSVNGNDVEITIKSKADSTDGSYIPKAGELVYDTERKILVIGDGTTSLGSLKAFYGEKVTSADILAAIGYTPEDSANKGQANGYAPLDASGKVPSANLPDSLTNTYSKTEIDDKDTTVLNSATTLINTEAARAKKEESEIKQDLTDHINDTTIHVTQTEKDTWNAKVDKDDLDDYENHINDTAIHVTQADKDKWNGMQQAYYVTDIADLPTTDNQIGNIAYVQVSAAGVTPVVCEEYIWDGSTWQLLDVDQVSLQMKWGNIQGRPAATPLTIDNTVTVAHSHLNKIVLDKIGQSAAGNFTFDGVEIGVRVMFLDNENGLPTTGVEDTLYVIYEDSRVRNYPSISVWRNGSYQMLGRGIQESAPVVGDMSILQSEYYSVVPGSTYMITVTQNQYFAFMPLEILREIEGLKDQERTIVTVDDPAKFNYKDYLLNITESKKLTISIKEREAELDTVSDFYYSHVDIDLDEYKDIDNIG